MNKGWHNEPSRHSLASQGIATKNYAERLINLGEADLIFEEFNLFNLEQIRKYRASNIISIDIGVRDARLNSTITYDMDTNELNGVVRLPDIDKKQMNNIKKHFGLTEDVYQGGIYHISKNIGFRFRNYKQDNITPHINFYYENANIKYIDEYIQRVHDYTKEVKDVLEK